MSGILMVESSSSHIENNLISLNLSANIAFGGKENSQNTVILHNRIINSSNEGIVVINSGRAEIRCNVIMGNNDGIVVVGSDRVLI